MTGGSPRRRALLLGCGTFADGSLAELRSPRHDVDELTQVLRDPEKCRYTVTAEVDCTSQRAEREIEGFFSAARVNDTMNLLYLSCHGVQDRQGRLYFAFADTERDFLGSTAVSAEWVRECIYSSRSKATLVLVDCCFSGAFIKGMRARSAGANVETLVHDLPHGTGVAVLTASGDTEASFEDADSAVVRPSYFTDALITGISSGAADLNRDGRVTADELYDYIYDQVTSGPSPQRPRRLGAGEGVLVVSDATGTPFSPPPVPVVRTRTAERQTTDPQPTTLVARGILGWVSFDGQWVVIGKNGVGHVYKGERRFHVSRLSGVAVKSATRLHHGFLQVILPGVPPAPVARFGLHAGRPPMTDDNSISFAKSANDDINQLRDALQAAIDTAHGHARPAQPGSPDPPGRPVPNQALAPTEGGVNVHRRKTAPGEAIESGRKTDARGTSVNGATPPPDGAGSHRRHDDLPTADPQADYRQGELDGAQAAHRLPLAALDSLVAHQFDVVRWLAPWRQYWSHQLGQPEPAASVPSWLPEFARYLGGHAAPPGSTNSTFTPPPPYLTGFCAGMRNTWNKAVTTGLLPPDRLTLTHWMAQPSHGLNLPMPLAEATIGDLTTVRKRAQRAARTRNTVRVVLWLLAGLLLLMEIAAIGVTIEGGWNDADGRPAADQTTNAIIANLGCSIPLIALCALIVIDLKRSRRKKTSKTIASDSPPADAVRHLRATDQPEAQNADRPHRASNRRP